MKKIPVVNIIPVIRDLLLRHQKIVIPGFGSFIVVKKPAQLNKATRDLIPPSVTVRFDPKQKSDDGRLTAAIRSKQHQSEAGALKVIGDFIKATEDAINLNQRVMLDGLGSLVKSKSGDLDFIPDEGFLTRMKIFELPKLSIPEAEPSKPAPASVTTPNTTPAAPVTPQRVNPVQPSVPKAAAPINTAVNQVHRRKRRWLVPAGIVLLLVALAAGLYYSGTYSKIRSQIERQLSGRITDDKKLTFGERNETGFTAKTDSVTEAISRQLDEKTSQEKALSYKEPISAPVETTTPSLPTERAISTGKKYHIIAGAFLVPNNAERQKKEMEKKGLKPEILPKRGDYFMVSLGSYDTQQEATKAMNELSKTLDNPLWIMKK